MAQKSITKLNADIVASIARYRAVLERLHIPVEQMIVFGSHAKGTAHPQSDIDLAVISPAFGRDDVEEMQMLWKKTHLADVRIEPFPLSPHDLAHDSSPIIGEIRKYGVTI